MKKLLLSLLALLGITAGASAMGLKAAYSALSNLPNVAKTMPDYNLPVSAPLSDQVGNLATAYNLDAQQIKTTATAAFAILNQVPLDYMINGGCNGQVGTFVYASPNPDGSFDMLLAAMSGQKGMVVFMFEENVSADMVNAFQSAPLKIEGSFLSLEASLPDGNEFNVILSKAR